MRQRTGRLIRETPLFVAACALTLLFPFAGVAAAASMAQPATVAIDSTTFQAFLEGIWPEAQSRGVSRAVFDATFAAMTPDAALAPLTRSQPEFAKPIGAYLASQVTPARVAAGNAEGARWASDLSAIENRYGVPRSILVAVWGLETNYGASTGRKDVVRSLATLAAMNYRPTLYRAELLACLDLLQKGDVRRQDLVGSWAGAMGQPQFMPSSFVKYAVDQDGDGRRDIWGSVPDTLASIANFLRQQGYRPDRPWGFEVKLPQGLDVAIGRGSFADWAARGVTRADGSPLQSPGDAVLFFPAGASGPAFLVTENFEVLKTYNFSDAYVLSVAQLADRMEGGATIKAAWPTAVPMSRPDRIALQTRLVALGFPVDNREGRISLALRDTIRLAQARVKMVPDGNPTSALLRALSSQ
ncbi:lytic murein transglycosylase [Lichenihabitans psoromatis]|uniref:lytic murein transglycosylase n=1 Tax=Lichenihabitans psoromatis TaxID=2528642 RepID=UPI00103665B6|nr:lytic murein transglycosylase [Lichenihabitans psoromatis]